MKHVIAFGVFDILHPGHIHYLKEAKNLGDRLTVVIARDESVIKIKGKAPKKPEVIRKEIIENLKSVDQAILGNKLSKPEEKEQILEELNPDIIALGYDQSFETNTYQIVRIEKLGDFSSSNYR